VAYFHRYHYTPPAARGEGRGEGAPPLGARLAEISATFLLCALRSESGQAPSPSVASRPPTSPRTRGEVTKQTP
jgi:hypothetical protein